MFAIATIMHRSSSSFDVFVYKKKETGSQPGLPGSTGFHRANSQMGFCLNSDRSQARVDPLGRFEFQNTGMEDKEGRI
jgi:hypothetical protein